MAYQINLTGQEIDERLQNVGTPADNPDANGTLFARLNKNVDDIDELSDAVLHIQDAQTATNKTVTQHTSDISTLQTTVSKNKTAQDAIAQKVAQNATAIVENRNKINDHESRQSNIEEVVSGERNLYFTLNKLGLRTIGSFKTNNIDIDNVKVKLYRWSGQRYSEFKMFTRNGTGVSQKQIRYEIILKKEQKAGANVRVPYIHYNDDGTEKELWLAVKDAFGERISYNRYKKRRWRIQAFLNDKPITAPFDFRVSVDHSGVVSLTKEGMMRSVPKAKEVVYNGFFSSTEWIKCKKGEVINCDYNASEKRFPQPGDFIESNRRGIVVASEYNSDGSYRILWTVGRTLYEIGIGGKVIEPSFVFYCTSPAKKLCDDIYDYASKMSSGTLRDLYISAGAVYNEQTGYYELNGLTDITEEEMRTIWQEDLSGWYQKGRTNLTRNISVKGNTGGYNGGIDIACICINNKNLQVFNLGADCFARYMDSAFRECSNLETIDTRFRVVPYDTSLGINTFRGCIKLKDVRFNNHYLRMKATLNLYDSPLISKESVLSAITTTDNASATSAGFLTITLHADAYARLKDDADIITALEAKNGVVTLVSA